MKIQIMGIINTSPDSFADDGVDVADENQLTKRLQKALDEGADILDIGGQSTRPGAKIIDVQEEIARVVPAVALARRLTDKPISVDTFKPAVAEAALKAGATIVNDISGCADPQMIRLVKDSGVEVIVMHMRGTPETMSSLTDYPNGVVNEIGDSLKQRAEELMRHGIAADNIIIDPGIGFAKTAPQSFELTRHLNTLTKLGFRVLYGASQKSFLGKALAVDTKIAPVEDRAVGTVVVQAYAMLQGATIVRVHDVRAAVQTRAIIEAINAEREVTI